MPCVTIREEIGRQIVHSVHRTFREIPNGIRKIKRQLIIIRTCFLQSHAHREKVCEGNYQRLLIYSYLYFIGFNIEI